MNSLNLEILTPERKVLDVQVSKVNLQGSMGRLGILPDHTSLIAKLDFGLLEYTQGHKNEEVLCGEGLVEVNDNKVTVVVRSAETSAKIDVERAKRSYERAKSRLHSKDEGFDLNRAENALKRANERLKFTKFS